MALNLNYQEFSKSVETEYDKFLKVDISGHHNLEADTLESLMLQTARGTQSVNPQMQTDTTIESPVVRSSIPRIRFPFAIITISLLQILLFVYDSMNPKNEEYDQSTITLQFASNYKTEIWRCITNMFVHQDELHLGMIVVFQLLGGVPLEIKHGWWRITVVYLVGVLGGSLSVQAVSSCRALIGGSAGVYSILGAHFSTLILNWKETEDRLVRICILLLYALADICNWMVVTQILNHPEFGSTACIFIMELTNSTIMHVCGWVFGILIAMVIFKNCDVHSCEHITQVISFLILLFLIYLPICQIIFFPNIFDESLTSYVEKCYLEHRT